jgi:hypothetical protein
LPQDSFFFSGFFLKGRKAGTRFRYDS